MTEKYQIVPVEKPEEAAWGLCLFSSCSFGA